MSEALSSWLQNRVVIGALVAFSIVAVLASVVLVPRFLARLPPNYLQDDGADTDSASASVPRRVLRNLLGVVLVLLGVAMLLLPGQGLLTLLVGLLLVDFPGKAKLVRRVLGQPKVLTLVNKLRQHRGSPPLHVA